MDQDMFALKTTHFHYEFDIPTDVKAFLSVNSSIPEWFAFFVQWFTSCLLQFCFSSFYMLLSHYCLSNNRLPAASLCLFLAWYFFLWTVVWSHPSLCLVCSASSLFPPELHCLFPSVIHLQPCSLVHLQRFSLLFFLLLLQFPILF